MKWRAWRVDWPNHLIGFFSALFGILIAFELEEWREAKNHQEDARIAFEKTLEEIDINKNSLHGTVNTNLKILNLLEVELLPFVNDRLQYNGSAREALTINLKVKPFAKIILTDTISSSVNAPVLINMGSLHHPPLLNSAWESAKATGVINYLEYNKVLTISFLYDIPRVTDELQSIRVMLRGSDEITTKTGLKRLIAELRESYLLIQSELVSYDTFANMIVE